MTQILNKLIKNLPESSLSSEVISKLNAQSSGNSNINVCTTTAEITTAGVNAFVEIQDDITLTSDYQFPANQKIFFTTGKIILDGFELDFNGSAIMFTGKSLGINAFTGTLVGNVILYNSILYSSNLGAIDDNLETTDNWQVGVNLLHITNQNSGHLYWNKQDTGVFYTSVYEADPFVAGQSPFYPNNFGIGWKIGRGYDNVTIEHGTDVTMKVIKNDLTESVMYHLYDTKFSTLKGGKLQGDRYDHRYNRIITVDTAATSASTVSLEIREPDNYNSSVILNTINESISLTVSNTNTNATEIANHINTNLGGQGYVASANADEVTFYKEGVDFEFDITPDSTGATFTETQSPYEWGHGVMIGSYTLFNTIKDIEICEFHGDAISGAHQGNGTSNIDSADMLTGFIDENGTIDGGNTDYRYLTITRNLPSPHEWFSFAPNAQSSLNLVHNKYWMLYYDENDNFLGKSKSLVPYERYRPRVYKDGRPEVSKYRVLIEYNGATDFTNLNYFINSRSASLRNTFENVEIHHTRRQGVSNAGIDFQFINCSIHDVGGQEPQFGIDIEDDHKHPMGWSIKDCHFQNNANGDIILKGASNGIISGCMFSQDSWNLRIGDDIQGLAIDTGYSRQITITNNFFKHKKLQVDIGTIVTTNQLFYSDVFAKVGGCLISNNVFENGTINDGTVINATTSQSGGGNSMSYAINNIFKINDGWGNKRFIDEANTINWVNNIYLFNDTSSKHFELTDASLQEVLVYDTSESYIKANRATTNNGYQEGTTKGDVVKALLINPTTRHRNGWEKYCTDFNDFDIQGNLIFRNGYEKSFTIKNGKSYGNLQFLLEEFPTDGVGDFETICIIGCDFTCPPEIDATNGNINNTAFGSTQWMNFIRTATDANVNFEFIDCKFDLQDSATNRFMGLGHRGTTRFERCHFIAAVSQTIDLTARGSITTSGNYRSTNNGDVTIVHCRYDNITFILDIGDNEIIY